MKKKRNLYSHNSPVTFIVCDNYSELTLACFLESGAMSLTLADADMLGTSCAAPPALTTGLAVGAQELWLNTVPIVSPASH